MKIISMSIGVGVLSMVGAIGWADEAKADLVFCNRIDRPIYMALSQKNPSKPKDGIVVKGWWYANPGQCQRVTSNNLSTGENYGYYAISNDGKQKWSDETNGTEVCIDDKGFDRMSTGSAGKTDRCIAPSYPVRFKWMEPQTKQNLTFDFKIQVKPINN